MFDPVLAAAQPLALAPPLVVASLPPAAEELWSDDDYVEIDLPGDRLWRAGVPDVIVPAELLEELAPLAGRDPAPLLAVRPGLLHWGDDASPAAAVGPQVIDPVAAAPEPDVHERQLPPAENPAPPAGRPHRERKPARHRIHRAHPSASLGMGGSVPGVGEVVAKRVSSGLHYARDLLLACLTIAAVVSVPKSYNDIAGKPDSEQWYSAVHDELLNMERMQVWSVVSYNDVSPGTRTVSCHFVLDVKRALDGSISRKARLCADGSRELLPEGLSASALRAVPKPSVRSAQRLPTTNSGYTTSTSSPLSLKPFRTFLCTCAHHPGSMSLLDRYSSSTVLSMVSGVVQAVGPDAEKLSPRSRPQAVELRRELVHPRDGYFHASGPVFCR